MAGAGQRLPRSSSATSCRSSSRPSAIRRLCEPHFGIGADGVLLLSQPDEPRLRRRAADLQPRRLGGRAVGQRRARGDPVPAPPRLDRRATSSRSSPTAGRDPPDDHRADDAARVDDGPAPRSPPPTSPAAPPDGRGDGRRRRARLGASSTSRSATRSARSRSPATSWRRSTWRAIGPAIETHELFPNRTNVSCIAELDGATASARGSSSAGWGRRSPPAPGATRRRGRRPCCAARRARHRRARRRRARGRGRRGPATSA